MFWPRLVFHIVIDFPHPSWQEGNGSTMNPRGVCSDSPKKETLVLWGVTMGWLVASKVRVEQ